MKYSYINGIQKSMTRKVTAVLASLILLVTPIFNTINAILPEQASAASNVSIFSSGFEDNFAGWLTHEENWTAVNNKSGAHEGTKRVQAKGNGDLISTVSTTDKKNVQLSYYYKLDGLDPEDSVVSSYSVDDGLTWVTLSMHTGQAGDSEDSTDWILSTNQLPMEASDKTGVKIKFSAALNSTSDKFNLDTVNVTADDMVIATPPVVETTPEVLDPTLSKPDVPTIIVKSDNLRGWSKYGEEQPEFVNEPSSTGAGALKVSTPDGTKYIQLDREAAIPTLARDMSLSYDTKRISGPAHASAGYVVAIDKDGDTSNNTDTFWAWYEPVYNNPDGKDYDAWNTWIINKDSTFWYNGAVPSGISPYTDYRTLTTVLINYPNAKVVGFSLNMGSGNGGWSSLIDKVKTTEAIYDFEPTVPEACNDSTFDTLSLGSINNQSGWKSTGNYDQEVVDNIYGYANLGCKSLRLSNAKTSGSFGDQTFSNATTAAGESSTGAANDHFEGSFDIASTKQEAQNGLSISVSPDDGTGNRISYLRFEDRSDGIHVYFNEVSGTDAETLSFNDREVAILPRTTSHNIKFTIYYKDGASNDVVKIYVDGTEKATGASWENYYRYSSEQSGNGNVTPKADRLLFRAAGDPAAANLGGGFLLDSTVTTSRRNNLNPVLTTVTPIESSFTSTATSGNKLRITGSFTDDVKPNYATFQLVRNGSSVAIGTLYGFKSVYNPAATYANADGSYNYDLSVPAGLENGEYSLFYTGTDFTGGVTERMERKFTIDNTVPSKPSIAKPSARQWFNASPIKTQWSAANDDASGVSRYQIAYHYDDNHSFGSSTCIGEVIEGKTVSGCRDTQATSRDHNPDQNEQGGVTVRVRAIDNAGNKGAWSQSVHYYYDKTPPSTTFEVPSGMSGGKFMVKGRAEDNLGLNRVYIQLINRQDNQRYGGTTVNLIPKGTSGDWSVDYDFTALNLPDGKYAAHASVTDMAGNSSSTGWTDHFTVDNTAPETSAIKLNGLDATIARAENCGPTDFKLVSGKIDLSATIKDASTVDSASYSIIKVNDGGCTMSNPTHDYGNGVKGYQSGTVNMSRTGESWSTPSGDNLDTKALELDGKYTIALTTKDQFGNSVTQYVDLEIDNTAPEITVNTPTVTETSRTVTGTVTGSPSSVKIIVNGADYTVEDIDPITGAFSREIDPLPVGEHRVKVLATDALGNLKMDDSKSFIITAPTSGNGDIDDNQGQDPVGNNDGDGQVNPVGNTTPSPAAVDRQDSQPSRPTTSLASAIPSTFSNFALTPLRAFGLIADGSATDAENTADSADTASTDTDSEVLGAKDSSKSDIEKDDPYASNNSLYKFYGIDWYWILTATALALLTGWFLIVAKRRKKADKTVSLK